MKILSFFLLFFLYSTLNADYLLTYHGNKCITSYSINDNSSYIDVVLSRNGNTKHYKTKVSNIHPGYVYDSDSDTCDLQEKLVRTGLNFEDYNFLMGLLGVLSGFGFFFSVLTIFGRK